MLKRCTVLGETHSFNGITSRDLMRKKNPADGFIVLRSRIFFRRLQVKILLWLRRLQLRLRLLPYCIARQKFENELKLKQMMKLSGALDSVRFILIKYELNGL
jgi:hypothetical protein